MLLKFFWYTKEIVGGIIEIKSSDSIRLLTPELKQLDEYRRGR
jgi:hypothetical protein